MPKIYLKIAKKVSHKKSGDFYFLITYGVCKKKKYCNRMSGKKKFSPFDKCSCLSVCLSVWMYVRTWTFHVDTITFEGVSGSKQNLVVVFYVQFQMYLLSF